jgi:protein SCO1/2
MRRVAAVIVLGGVALLGGGMREASAQSTPSTEAFQVDPALAKRGQSVFRNRGCEACHTIGKGKQAGPDLAGVLSRRSADWVRRWLKNTTEMINTDSTAQALVTEYKGLKMPSLRLTDQDIENVMHYMAQESAKVQH